MNLSSLAAHLLAQNSPVHLLFRALNGIWQGSAELDSFRARQERETTHLQKILPGHLL